MYVLEELFGKLFADKLPPLPPNIREWAVKLLPWILIILGALGLFAWLGTIGLFGIAQVSAMNLHYTPSFLAAIILYIFVPVLQLAAIAAGYLMLSRKRLGWAIAFYALLLGLLIHLLHLSLGGLIVDFIYAYVLFQVRPYFRET